MVTKYLKKKIAIALVAAMAIGGVTPTQIVPSFKMESVKAEETTPIATPAPIVAAEFDYNTKMLKVGVKSSETTKPVALGNSFYYQTVLYGNDGSAGALKANKWVAIEAAYNENNSGSTVNYTNVDFSWLSCTRKQDLYVVKDATAAAAGTETPVKITINAQNVDLSIKYYGTLPTGNDAPAPDYYVGNDVTGYLVSVPKATGKAKVALAATEYKTENGAWTAVTSALSTELLKYVNKGVKLQFRVAPNSAAENVAGKTVTVSVPAKANGPKVTVDYNKQQITFPKGSEYILSTAYGKEGEKWTAAPLDGNKVKTLYFDDKEIGYNGTDAKTFYVRTAAKQNKVCSKITVVTIGAQVTVADDVVNVANGTGLLATKYDANNDATKDKVFIQYKTPYDKLSGLLITNNSNKAYQVAVVKRTDIEDCYKTTEAGKDFIASKMIIGDRNSKIKFTDVKAYTVNKTTGVTKEGSATIATKDLFKTANGVTPEIADYAILYRQYDKSSKTNTAPAKTYMVDMAATLNQTLTVSDGADSGAIVSTNTEQNNAAKELVGTATKLNLTCLVSPEFNKNSKSVAKVYTKPANGTYTPYNKFTVKIADNKKDVTVQAQSAAADGEYYVGVTLEGATTYYKINYVKAKQLTLGDVTGTLTAGTADDSATIALTTAGVANDTAVTTKWVKAANSTETETVTGITVQSGKINANAGSVKVTIEENCTAGEYYLAITVDGVTKVATITVAASTSEP